MLPQSYDFISKPARAFWEKFLFSLPTQEFFRGQGKIKVGTGMDNFKNITYRKSTRPNDALYCNLTMRIINT